MYIEKITLFSLAGSRSSRTDFGFATLLSNSSTPLHTHCGSYAYAAPEVLHGQPYDGTRTDTWSLWVLVRCTTDRAGGSFSMQ